MGNCIYVSISKYGSDTPVTRPETDKAGLSSRDRKRGGGNLKCYFFFLHYVILIVFSSNKVL